MKLSQSICLLLALTQLNLAHAYTPTKKDSYIAGGAAIVGAASTVALRARLYEMKEVPVNHYLYTESHGPMDLNKMSKVASELKHPQDFEINFKTKQETFEVKTKVVSNKELYKGSRKYLSEDRLREISRQVKKGDKLVITYATQGHVPVYDRSDLVLDSKTRSVVVWGSKDALGNLMDVQGKVELSRYGRIQSVRVIKEITYKAPVVSYANQVVRLHGDKKTIFGELRKINTANASKPGSHVITKVTRTDKVWSKVAKHGRRASVWTVGMLSCMATGYAIGTYLEAGDNEKAAAIFNSPRSSGKDIKPARSVAQSSSSKKTIKQ